MADHELLSQYSRVGMPKNLVPQHDLVRDPRRNLIFSRFNKKPDCIASSMTENKLPPILFDGSGFSVVNHNSYGTYLKLKELDYSIRYQSSPPYSARTRVIRAFFTSSFSFLSALIAGIVSIMTPS